LIEKETVKDKIKKKIFELCRKNDKLVLLQSRYEEITNLINANKKSETLNINEVSGNTGVLDFSYSTLMRKKKGDKGKKKAISPKNKNKISIPFYIYPLKNQKVSFGLI